MEENGSLKGSTYCFVNPKGKEPTLVFLHDALGSIAQWKDFPSLLCELTGHRGLVYNRDGHGFESEPILDRNANYLQQYSSDFIGLIEALAIEQAFLIGHSDGGSIALIAGSKYIFSGIISIAAHVIVEAETITGIEQATSTDNKDKLIEKLRKYHANPKALVEAWELTWLAPSFKLWDITPELSKIQAPVLAIQGDEDEYGTQKQVEIIQSQTPSSYSFFIPSAGHSPHLTHKLSTLNACVSFILKTT